MEGLGRWSLIEETRDLGDLAEGYSFAALMTVER
jgi:hypothetical protein